jgi:acetyltransferase-like isoleucine patch superfamily enzyme
LRYLAEILAQVHLKVAIVNLICRPLPRFGSGVLRGRLYRLAGLDVHPTAFIMGNLDLAGGCGTLYDKLSIGAGSVIGDNVTINLDAPVRLGTNVSIGPQVLIYTATHPIGPGSNRRAGQVLARPVCIDDGSWIGLRATIMPGVTIGKGAIVAAGSVVDSDVAPHTYVQGNPAQAIRELPWPNR